jgi:hypothetical protein
MANANIPLVPLGLNKISLSAAFKELYNRPTITALQRKRKGKENATEALGQTNRPVESGRRKRARNERPAVAASSAMAVEAEEIEAQLDVIEMEDAIADDIAIAQELKEEALRESLQEEVQERIRITALKEQGQCIAQELEDAINARIAREAAGNVVQATVGTESVGEIQERSQVIGLEAQEEQLPITPRRRRKKVRYSPSPVQRQQRQRYRWGRGSRQGRDSNRRATARYSGNSFIFGGGRGESCIGNSSFF